MTVFFIGAGPGAADLLTVRADRLIRSCPVCLYAGSIVPPEVLENCPDSASVINTARMPLDQITDIMAQAHAQGKDVARLQSGDPSIYSAVAEQVRRLTALGIDYEIIPGVPAFSAVAAALGHELTVPTVGQTVILTRVNGRASQMPADPRGVEKHAVHPPRSARHRTGGSGIGPQLRCRLSGGCGGLRVAAAGADCARNACGHCGQSSRCWNRENRHHHCGKGPYGRGIPR